MRTRRGSSSPWPGSGKKEAKKKARPAGQPLAEIEEYDAGEESIEAQIDDVVSSVVKDNRLLSPQ
jgi:hypothetical protein